MINLHAESAGKYIGAIYRHLQMLITPRLEQYRIGSGQYIFLLTIARKPGITQKGLSEELSIDKTTTTKAIAKLESEGYVRREPDPSDNRFNLLYLTDAGREVVPKVKAVLDELMASSRRGITEEEYGQMISLLRIMLSNVTELARKGEEDEND